MHHTPKTWPTALKLSGCSLAALLLIAACGGDDNQRNTTEPTPAPTPAPAPAPAPTPIQTSCAITTHDGSVVVGSGLAGDPSAPEPASGYRLGKEKVLAEKYMVVTANPHASKAGCDVLSAGGSAIDAAVAVQAVLGLVEPQSSGIGGGAFMLYYDAATKKVTAYDGRETAPAAATENYLRWIDESTPTTPLPSTRTSGRSIGVPGVIRMLDLAHQEHGQKPWDQLFQPGIDLASNGFLISGRMASALEGGANDLARDKDAKDLYFNANGSTHALGEKFTNPLYAQTLHSIATGGADAFYQGDIAQAIVDKVNSTENASNPNAPLTPGQMTLADLAHYEAKVREPVCTTYRAQYMICGMPPPSSGGIAVASLMGILENFDLRQYAPLNVDINGGTPTVLGVHLVSEAGRLAYADRDKYVADTDFVPLPGNSWMTLLNKPYLQSRANLIQMDKSNGIVTAGEFGTKPLSVVDIQERGTTHMTIVDAQGNVVSMTTTVEGGMGSYHLTRGFILNNQLTDFSTQPVADGNPVANRVEPGKRPRSSMAPTLVFNLAQDGSIKDLKMATGSPGGGTIIQYVSKTLVGVLDWGLDAQQATSMVDFGATNSKTTNVGGEHPNVDNTNDGANDALIQGLKALGHTVNSRAQSSGIGTIVSVEHNGSKHLEGGADPRREGLVLGDGK